jgi:hypothetical protein
MRFAETRQQSLNAFWRTIMRNNLILGVALIVIGFAVPASAADIGYVQEPAAQIYVQAGPLPLQAAVDIANGIGLVSVSNTNNWGDEWQIEGYDVAGSYMEVDIDARTGAVVNVDR